MTALAAIRVLADLALPSGTLRFWDGSSGTFVDLAGNKYKACVLTDDALKSIDLAINAEAFTLNLTISGIDVYAANAIWADYQAGLIAGSKFRIMIQDCDDYDQPLDTPSVLFTGSLDNLVYNKVMQDTVLKSTISIEVTNRFVLRNLAHGAVLSDVDQKARSKILNPSGTPDRICERMNGLRDKRIRWPNWN